MDFGTSGLRGMVADMSDDACARWTRAFLAHLATIGPPPRTLLVGRDLRPSSPRIAAACLRAAVAAGLRAVDCGATPTPALAQEAMRQGAPAAMVTGSHIPFDRNGVKFFRADGEIDKNDEQGVRAMLATPVPDAPNGTTVGETGAAARYLERALAAFPPGFLRGRRIGAHEHSAVGRDLLVEALRRAGAETASLGRADAFVAIDTEAVDPGHAAQLRDWAKAGRYDAIVSTDGDGDRPLVADEAGEVIRGDALGLLVARSLDADAVATPVTTTAALERSGWFARVARTRIGSPHVIAAMAALAAAGARRPVGFEANGGFLVGAAMPAPSGRTLSALPTRDALLPILAALAMAGKGPLSRLRALIPPRVTASGRLPETPATASAPLLAALADDPAARAAFCGTAEDDAPPAIDLTDGPRMTLADGRVLHLRQSGNAPELRVYAEADDAMAAETLRAAGLAAARAWLADRPG
jgi:phosphomannomutase